MYGIVTTAPSTLEMLNYAILLSVRQIAMTKLVLLVPKVFTKHYERCDNLI